MQLALRLYYPVDADLIAIRLFTKRNFTNLVREKLPRLLDPSKNEMTDRDLYHEQDDIGKYVKLVKLGEAFHSDEQVILLIDEIDKADLEFPNDLLWELDKMEFYIPETKETVKAKQRPIVIITSNAEKELPDAFLRRCIFHYIEFPDAEQMEEIIKVHFDHVEENILKQVLATFYWIRGLYNIQKKPSTSEVIDWIRALELGGVPASKIKEAVPFAGGLLKKNEDIDTMRKFLK